MEIKFDIFSIIITLGIIQGLFLSFVFFRIKKANKKANYVLSFFLFIISVSICSSVLLFTNLFRYVPHFIRSEIILLFMFPPVLFLYVKVLTNHNYKYRLSDLLYFVPAGVALIILSPFFLSDAQTKIAYYQDVLSGKRDLIDVIFIIFLNFQEWFYIIKILRQVKRHQDNIKQHYSNIDEVNLSWIRVSVIAFLFVASCAQVFSILMLFCNYPYLIFYRFLPMVVTFSIFYLGYKGLMQQEVFPTVQAGGRRKNRLKETKYEKYYLKIVRLLEDQKLYVNPELAITDIGNRMSLTAETIAKIILGCSGRNYYDFINEFRIKEAKKYLMSGKDGLGMPAVALRCGFKSESNFNRIFTKHTRLTPLQFQHRYRLRKSKTSKKTIGVFIDSLYDTFGASVLYGANKFAFENNLNVLCFNGGALNSPYYNYSQKTKIYDLISLNNLDGIIAISVLLGQFISKEALIGFYKKFSHIPVVGIGMEIKGMPCIRIDNEKGVRDLLAHLIKVHGYRRIAYINGPEGNTDAMQRHAIYKDVLREFGIGYDPGLTAPGTFVGISGKQAVQTFLDERQAHFDALFAANDYMAIQAIQELHARGIRVPEDIAVVGFDDVIESRYLMRPLTTVTQPVFETGYLAAENLLKLINNEYVENNTILQTGVIIRNSCGCAKDEHDRSADLMTQMKKIRKSSNDGSMEEMLIPYIRNAMYSSYGNLVNITLLSEWITLLWKTLHRDIESKSTGGFIAVLKRLIIDARLMRIDISFWYLVVDILFGYARETFESVKDIIHLEKIIESTSGLILFIKEKDKEYPVLRTYEQAMKLYLISQALLTAHNEQTLREILTVELPKLGIKSCFLSVYEETMDDAESRPARCIVSYQDYKNIHIEEEHKMFAAEDLVPGGLVDTSSDDPFILMALYFQNKEIGFILYQGDNIDVTLFEMLTLTLSSVLNSIVLYERLQRSTGLIKKRPADEKLSRSEKSGIPDEKYEEYFRLLLAFMEEEKIYTDPDLTLPVLAEETAIPRNQLSYVINKFAGLNFYDFINSYRVEEAKKHLADLKGQTGNILEIAFEAGFKSKSTFNKMFKRYTSKTPTEFIKLSVPN
jgi:DNA-binding LacI/PurR family transcriptional regulator/AraC-like DNA-binding protein